MRNRLPARLAVGLALVQAIGLATGLVMFLAIMAFATTVFGQTEDIRFRALSTEISAAISPAEADLMAQAVAAAAAGKFDLLMVRLDTPGGTLEATRALMQSILNSPVPVAVWVGPAGARAASAGVFITAAAHVAAMAPQTTIGAATPVSLGGEDVPETAARKVMNDIKSMVRGMAEARGRNVDWYMQAIDEGVSITANEAQELNVIDLLAATQHELVEAVGRGEVLLEDEKLDFSAQEYVIEEFDAGWRYRLLSWLLNPQVAYFLLLAGMAGLFFEFVSPGGIFPGVVGGICLLLALYALSILPTNAAGILLILLGLGLFFLEIEFVSYGLLTIAGIIALFMGSVILFPTVPGAGGLSMATIIVTVTGVSLILGVGVYLAARAQTMKPQGGREGLLGSRAEVRRWQNGRGLVFVHGELWSARTADASSLNPGDEVRVVHMEDLMLTVEKVADEHIDNP